MIALLIAYACHRLGVQVDNLGAMVPVPLEVVEKLRAQPGRRLRARFEVLETVEAERKVFVMETETHMEVQ